MLASARRRANKPSGAHNDVAATPDASKRSSRKLRKTSGSTSVETKEAGSKPVKGLSKSSLTADLCRILFHLLFVLFLIFFTIAIFEYHMKQAIEWEKPKVEEPKMMKYYGASIITKDFDCSILARRCHMSKRKMRPCFMRALACVSMLRPDLFPTNKRDQQYYVNIRHYSSNFDLQSKTTEKFTTYHEKIKRAHLFTRINQYEPDLFQIPFHNSKGMPRDNQLFFIPWEIEDQEDKYASDFEFIDLNIDDVFDCVRPKVNTEIGRRKWLKSMSDDNKGVTPPAYYYNYWHRSATQRTDHIRVDTVPGFAGAFVKKIVENADILMDTERAHAVRQKHEFSDETVLLIYRHILLHALANPYLMLFHESKWKESIVPFNPDKAYDLPDEEMNHLNKLKNPKPSISFLFGAHTPGVSSQLPDTLAVTISGAGTTWGGKEIDLNVPIRLSCGQTSVEIVSSAQGERAFHANIIAALRIILRLRLYKGESTFNNVLHIPIAFFSLEEHQMIFDNYDIMAPLREKLCENVEDCATPFDQTSVDWQTRFNGTTAIQSNGKNKLIFSRLETSQDSRNYAVGY